MNFARRWLVLAVFAALFAAIAGPVACGGRTFGEKTVVIAAGADGDILFPMLYSQAQSRVYTELAFEKLADIGQAQNTVGDAGYEARLAASWTWSTDSLAIRFAIDPRARWHDGRPVRASDVKFGFDLATDPKVASSAGADVAQLVDSITVADSLTAVAWFKVRSAEQFHRLVYNLIPLPQHLLAAVKRDSVRQSAFASLPVGNGPFRIVSWQKNVRLELAAFDSFARGRPKLDRVIFAITGDAPSATRAVLAGDADFVETVGFDEVSELRRQPDVRPVLIGGYDYGFLLFNLRAGAGTTPHPVLGSAPLRRALTMATDRAAMLHNVFDSLGRVALGPFSRSQWSSDTTLQAIPFDVAAAEHLLDSLGWVKGANGIRAKGGRPLALTMIVFASSRARVRYAELVQQAFTKVGVKTTIDNLDGPAFRDRLATRKFDAALFTWRATPSPSSATQTWGSRGYAPSSVFNAGAYLSPAFEAHADSAVAARQVGIARAHYRVAYQTAIDDAPAIWLYEPLVVAAASRRLTTGTMRPDAWWQSIREWNVSGPPRRAATKLP